MGTIQIKIINESNNTLPEYATAGSSGMDLRAWLTAPITIQSLERTLVPTGLFVEIPEGYEAQIRPRSGLAVKQGITVLNTPGTIDSDYRGEIKVIVVNLSKEEQTINPGDRVAQTTGWLADGRAQPGRAGCVADSGVSSGQRAGESDTTPLAHRAGRERAGLVRAAPESAAHPLARPVHRKVPD